MSNDNTSDLAKKMKALAGIQEGDKKFLSNESYQENISKKIIKESMGDITPEEWAQMHPERQLSRDQVNPGNWKGMDEMPMSESKDESDFIILEFDQEDVELGHDDEELYRLNK